MIYGIDSFWRIGGRNNGYHIRWRAEVVVMTKVEQHREICERLNRLYAAKNKEGVAYQFLKIPLTQNEVVTDALR